MFFVEKKNSITRYLKTISVIDEDKSLLKTLIVAMSLLLLLLLVL